MNLATGHPSHLSHTPNPLKRPIFPRGSGTVLGGVALVAAGAGWFTANHFGVADVPGGPVTLPLVSNLIALSLAGLFALAGISHLISANLLRGRYRPREFAPGFTRVAGVTELFTAVLLAVPQTRIWGGVLAAMILFTTVVWLLNRGRYVQAVPLMLAMAAIVPALAVTS